MSATYQIRVEINAPLSFGLSRSFHVICVVQMLAVCKSVVRRSTSRKYPI